LSTAPARSERRRTSTTFLDNYPFKLESIDPYLPEELQGKTTRAGYLQLLPGIHESDGFFLARLKRVSE